jgi:hypothetical protein
VTKYEVSTLEDIVLDILGSLKASRIMASAIRELAIIETVLSLFILLMCKYNYTYNNNCKAANALSVKKEIVYHYNGR